MQQKIFIGIALTLIIAIFIPVYWAMESGRQEAASQRQLAEAVGRGGHLYSSNCAVCHGPQGGGGVGPALKGSQLDGAVLKKIISRGVPGTAMSAWSKEDNGPLNQQQVNDLVTFIKNWDSALPAVPVAPPPSPPAAAAIDAQKLFATNCAMCHGQNRQGTPNLAPAVTPASLEKFSDAEVRDVISKGRPGTAMAGFGGRLSSGEIDAIVDLVKRTPP